MYSCCSESKFCKKPKYKTKKSGKNEKLTDCERCGVCVECEKSKKIEKLEKSFEKRDKIERYKKFQQASRGKSVKWDKSKISEKSKKAKKAKKAKKSKKSKKKIILKNLKEPLKYYAKCAYIFVSTILERIVNIVILVVVLAGYLLNLIVRTIAQLLSFIIQLISIIPFVCFFYFSTRLKCIFARGYNYTPPMVKGSSVCAVLLIIILYFIFVGPGMSEYVMFKFGFMKKDSGFDKYLELLTYVGQLDTSQSIDLHKNGNTFNYSTYTSATLLLFSRYFSSNTESTVEDLSSYVTEIEDMTDSSIEYLQSHVTEIEDMTENSIVDLQSHVTEIEDMTESSIEDSQTYITKIEDTISTEDSESTSILYEKDVVTVDQTQPIFIDTGVAALKDIVFTVPEIIIQIEDVDTDTVKEDEDSTVIDLIAIMTEIEDDTEKSNVRVEKEQVRRRPLKGLSAKLKS